MPRTETLNPPPLTITPPTGILQGVSEMPRKLWTRDECRRLVEFDVLEAGHYELIEGEIIVKMGQGRLHVFVMTRLLPFLIAVFGADFVQSQAPIGYSETTEPEPDAAVLVRPVGEYLQRNPTPSELRLIVEVADSTLKGDLTVKALLYARAGIPEYWVVDINSRCLHIHREPTEAGYTVIAVAGQDETISPLAAPEAALRVADLLP